MSKEAHPGICAYPFARMETRFDRFDPCCLDWLTDEYHGLEVGKDPWNGPAAQELRKRILKGDYSLCRRDRCHTPLYQIEDLRKDLKVIPEAPLSKDNFEAICEGETQMPDSPQSISVIVDPRCNLACPSCRSEPIYNIGPTLEGELFKVVAFFNRYRKGIQVVKMAGDGEVFFSPFLRHLLKELYPGNYPSLSHISLLSNGLLANEKNFDLLKPGTEWIRRISISVDAGTEEVYKKVRRGDWSKLVKNLQWLGGLRSKGRLDHFNMTFVVQEENFETIPQFVDLAKSVGVDKVYLPSLMHWPNAKMTQKEYHSRAIHRKSHPRHFEFLKIYENLQSNSLLEFRLSQEQ